MVLYDLVWHSVIQASRGEQGTKFSPWLTEHALAGDRCATKPDGLLFSSSFLVFEKWHLSAGIALDKSQKVVRGWEMMGDPGALTRPQSSVTERWGGVESTN